MVLLGWRKVVECRQSRSWSDSSLHGSRRVVGLDPKIRLSLIFLITVLPPRKRVVTNYFFLEDQKGVCITGV